MGEPELQNFSTNSKICLLMSAIGNIKQWQKEVIYNKKHTLE
jgi:hypothetical protein